jgi:hypothetical protein
VTDINDMSFDELVPSKSKYLAKSDVGDDGVILTIRGFKHEEIEGDDGTEEKTVMYFREGGYKPMILNRTNAALLAGATGVGTAGEAKGKQIVVYNDPSVGFGGKITGGLRIKKVPGPAAAPKVAEREPGSDDDLDF